MKQPLQMPPSRLSTLFTDAARLADQFEDLRDAAAADNLDPDLLGTLARLTTELRQLRDGLHDAALDPTDDLAEPRLQR